MWIKAVLSSALVLGLTGGLAGVFVSSAEAQTRRSQNQDRYIYYRQSAPDYYGITRVRNGRRIVVQPRSYLSAGTETKQYEEPYTNYAFPPGGGWDYQHRNSMQGSFTRMPLADPWDIPGWPKF